MLNVNWSRIESQTIERKSARENYFVALHGEGNQQWEKRTTRIETVDQMIIGSAENLLIPTIGVNEQKKAKGIKIVWFWSSTTFLMSEAMIHQSWSGWKYTHALPQYNIG